MLWLALGIALGLSGGLFSQGGGIRSCYGNICWRNDKSPESQAELRQIRRLAQSGQKAYRLQAEKTAASFLNRSFILPSYQGRSVYVEDVSVFLNRAVVLVSFSDATHMAFELYRPCFDGVRDIWVVKRYAYLDENPL